MGIEYCAPKKLVYGENTFFEIVPNLLNLNVQRVFVLFSGSALKCEFHQSLKQLCLDANIHVSFFEMPKGEPTMALLEIATKLFRKNHCDGVVAIGGGSAIDLAKAVAAISKNESQSFQSLAELKKFDRYPLIAVPTTAGTGSEATKISVLTDSRVHVKYNPGHVDLIPDVAILDPVLTLNVPKYVTAFTGIDALTHAIEAYVSTKANEVTDFFALQAIQMISQSIVEAYHHPKNIEARSQMLLGSYYAGLAFSNASTNLAHAMGRAIGTKWNLPHGQSVAIMHPFVVKYSIESCKGKYDDVAKALGLTDGYQVERYLLNLNQTLQVWDEVKFIGDIEFLNSIEEMTRNAMSGNGILTNHQIPTEMDVRQIYLDLHEFMKILIVQGI